MDDVISILYKRIPYYKTLGFELIEVNDGKAHFELDIRKELTQNGSIHGGVLGSLIDSTCACAAFSTIFPNGFVTTIDLQVEFLRPISKGRLIAKAECIKKGRTIFFCKGQIWNDQGKLVCTGSSQLLRIDMK